MKFKTVLIQKGKHSSVPASALAITRSNPWEKSDLFFRKVKVRSSSKPIKLLFSRHVGFLFLPFEEKMLKASSRFVWGKSCSKERRKSSALFVKLS